MLVPGRSWLGSAPMAAVNPGIFKAYDIRGIHGRDLDADGAELSRPRVRAGDRAARGQARPPSCASASAVTCALTAPEMAAAYAARHGRGGRARARRRAGRHRDALLPRRLARPRRRADVHRLSQPKGLHRRQAGAARRGGALRRRGHRRHQRAGRRRASATRPGGGTVEQVEIYDEFHRQRDRVHRSAARSSR